MSGRWGKVRSHDITTLYVDIPKEEEADDPASYRVCLKRTVSLAHQIAIRLALSRHCTKNIMGLCVRPHRVRSKESSQNMKIMSQSGQTGSAPIA